MNEVYYGTIEEVVPPNNNQNKTGTEYEYNVLIDYHNGASVLLRNVRRADAFGAGDDFEDLVLLRGQRVLMLCPKGQIYHSYIIAGIRSAFRKTDVAKAHHYLRRFNEIENLIDNLGTWSIKSDQGPNISVGREKIILDASSGDSITIDKTNKLVQITTNKWDVVVNGNATIKVSGDASLSAKNISATAEENLSVKCKKANIDAQSEVTVKTQKAKIDAKQVTVAGEEGQVITTATQPTCYVTGIPFVGSSKVKAGS